MNILHCTTFLQGGAGKVVHDLAIGQQEAGHTVSVLCTKTPEPGYCSYSEYVESLQRNNIDVYEIDSTFKRDVFLNCAAAEWARSVIGARAVDVFHAHAAVPAMVGVIARAGQGRYVPIIQTMHGWGTNKTVAQERTDVTIMSGLDEVIAVSNSSMVLLQAKGVDPHRIRVIYNGLAVPPEGDDGDSDPIVTELRQVRSAGRKVVGCIGTVCHRKNQAVLLDAIGQLVSELDVFLVFVGEGELIPVLQARTVSLNLNDCVRFYGYQPAASRYLKYFDCLVLPSLSEGLPVVVIEAFRERIPVAASHIPEIAEIVVHGKTGFLFKPDDVLSLVSCLREVLFLDDGAKKYLLDNGYRLYQSRFTVQRMVADYLCRYRYLTGTDKVKSAWGGED